MAAVEIKEPRFDTSTSEWQQQHSWCNGWSMNRVIQIFMAWEDRSKMYSSSKLRLFAENEHNPPLKRLYGCPMVAAGPLFDRVPYPCSRSALSTGQFDRFQVFGGWNPQYDTIYSAKDRSRVILLRHTNNDATRNSGRPVQSIRHCKWYPFVNLNVADFISLVLYCVDFTENWSAHIDTN